MKKFNYLIQFLRKNNMEPNYMAGYLNTILLNLIDFNNSSEYRLNIWGACWGRVKGKGKAKPNSVSALVNAVFKNVPKDIAINLCRAYPKFSAEDIEDELIRNGFLRSRIILPEYHDHSKRVVLSKKGQPIFAMIGSSNFSKTTYMDSNNRIDQADISFTQVVPESFNFINDVCDTSDNDMLDIWRDALNIESNGDNESGATWREFISKSNKFYIPSYPYSGKSNLIQRLFVNETSILLDFSLDMH